MIKTYLTDSIVIKTKTKDKWGEVTTTDEETIKGRFNQKNKLVRDLNGSEVVSTGELLIANRTLTHADVIEFNDVDYSIIDIQTVRDFSNTYLKLYLK
jgi:flagella basal body P-ring formation protein FlgA